MNWLLLFVPITIGLEFIAPERYLFIFATSAWPFCPLRPGWAGRRNNLLSAWAKALAGF